MNFQTHKIKDKPTPPPPKPKYKLHKKKLSINISIVIFIGIIIILFVGIYKAITSIDFKFFLSMAGEELQTDSFGHTNFLLLGIGGGNHDGADLTDTIIVASLDNENKLVTLLSIPRDLYISDPIVGSSKINEVYYYAKKHYDSSVEGIEHFKRKIEETTGMPIHYWMLIDFQGFKDLIDAFDGVDIYVEDAIYDPFYPKDGTIQYETFSISEGEQHLDGETALKYARSRKTTNDFDRGKRQQQILYALKEKALQTEVLFDKDKITNILDTLKEHIETNIKVKEILTLGSFAADFSENNIAHRFIHDDQYQCGGLVYTPARELYNNLFVLIPAGGDEFIHQFANYNLNYPVASHSNPRITVVNGTKENGVAYDTKLVLRRLCFEIPNFGNGRNQDITETTYFYRQTRDENGEPTNEKPLALDYLQTIIPGKESTNIPQEYLEEGYMGESDIILELGSDYTSSPNYIEDPWYNLVNMYIGPSTTEKEDDEEDTETESSAESTTESADEPTASEPPLEAAPVVPEEIVES